MKKKFWIVQIYGATEFTKAKTHFKCIRSFVYQLQTQQFLYTIDLKHSRYLHKKMTDFYRKFEIIPTRWESNFSSLIKSDATLIIAYSNLIA